MLTTVLTASALFIVTNIDDMLVLTVLFAASRSGSPKPWQIIVGQVLGFGAIVALSALVALGFFLLPEGWIGLLGFVPLAIGVRGLLRWRGRRRSAAAPLPAPLPAAGAPTTATPATRVGVWGVVAMTVSNGGDNVALYAPTLHAHSAPENALIIVTFFAMLALWCVVGRLIGTHPLVSRALERIEAWFLPLVFIALGSYIIAGSDLIPALFG